MTKNVINMYCSRTPPYWKSRILMSIDYFRMFSYFASERKTQDRAKYIYVWRHRSSVNVCMVCSDHEKGWHLVHLIWPWLGHHVWHKVKCTSLSCSILVDILKIFISVKFKANKDLLESFYCPIFWCIHVDAECVGLPIRKLV